VPCGEASRRAGLRKSGPLPGDLAIRFPNIEIVDLRGAGAFWYLNPTRVSRLASEKLKIVAPLLDIPIEEMPRLRQEEEHRQQTRRGVLAGVVLGILTAVSGLSVFALESRNQALGALEDSMFATGSMVLMADGLDDNGGGSGARIRLLLVNHGCDLIDKLSSSSGVEPGIKEYVACQLYRARDHEREREQSEAQARYEQAIRKAAARYARLPRPDAADALIQARHAYGEYFIRQNDDDAAESQYRKLVEAAQNYDASGPSRPQYEAAEAGALTSLGDLYSKRGDRKKAAESYDQAAAGVRRQIAMEGDQAATSLVTSLAGLWRAAGTQHRLMNDPDGAIQRFSNGVGAINLIPEDRTPPELKQEAAIIYAEILEVQSALGNAAAAQQAGASALSEIAQVLSSQDAPAELKERAQGLRTWIETQQRSH
jgi:tetratricopeptide (TPR) repeat protein